MEEENQNESKNTNSIEIKTYSKKENKYSIIPVEDVSKETPYIIKFDNDLHISSIKEKEGYTIIILHKVNSYDDKYINYASLRLEIKKNLSNKTQLKEGFIEIKEEKKIKKIDFESLKFINCDIFIVNKYIALLFIFFFNKFYLYKIYENLDDNEDILYYNRLNFEYNKYSRYLFLGNTLNDNYSLEYAFLAKPDNIFLFFNFNLKSLLNKNNDDDIEYKLEERYLSESDKQKILLKKCKRGINIDKYLFLEEDKFILIFKDKSNSKNMAFFPLEIFYRNNVDINNLKNPFLFKIAEKMFIIIDFAKNSNLQKIENIENKAIFGIFEISFNKEKNIFKTELLQEININIHSQNYNFIPLSSNKILLDDKNILYYISFDNNCLVKNIKQYKMDLAKSKGKKYYIYEDNKIIRISCTISKNEIYYILINKPNIKKYESFITSVAKDNLKDLINPYYKSLEKKYESCKNNLNEQNVKEEKKAKEIEKLSEYIIKVTKDDKKTTNKNNEEINVNNKNNLSRSQIVNMKYTPEQINYINQIKNINQIQNQINPNNQINQINQINPLNNIDPRINNINLYNQLNQLNQFNQLNQINQLSQINQINQLNQINNLNLQNSANVNLLPNFINNNSLINQQNYNNIIQNYLKYQSNQK